MIEVQKYISQYKAILLDDDDKVLKEIIYAQSHYAQTEEQAFEQAIIAKKLMQRNNLKIEYIATHKTDYSYDLHEKEEEKTEETTSERADTELNTQNEEILTEKTEETEEKSLYQRLKDKANETL